MLRAYLFFSLLLAVSCQDKPNIIVILADDLGFEDIGYTNPDVLTPNIDDLARNGVILERNYVQQVCTPSRAALMTGIYPYKLGLQGMPFAPNDIGGIPENITLLPQYLKTQGYATHLVGKWHLGNCKENYLPHKRGFDTFFGYWEGAVDYYDKTFAYNGGNLRDFHLNEEPFDDEGEYSMDLYDTRIREVIESHDSSSPLFLYAALQTVHQPLEVPQKYLDLYPTLMLPQKRTYYGMLSAMDELVGNLVSSLKENGLYDNSVIIWSSDNGALPAPGSNAPLRGWKAELYEGGIRVPGFVHSPNLVQEPGRIHSGLVHISDWYPTIMRLVEGSFQDDEINSNFDGVNQYDSVFQNVPENPRKMVVNEIDYAVESHGSLKGAFQIEGGWKYVLRPINPYGFVEQMYNVNDDPSESHGLKNEHPDIFEAMQTQFLGLAKDLISSKREQTNSDISDGNGNLATGWC